MISSFRRKWPTFMKYAAIGVTAFVFSAAPVSAQDAKQQQIDALNARLEKLEQQNQKLLQLLEQKATPAVVPVEMQPPSAASQPEDVRKIVEKVLKDKEDAKKKDDDKKKKDAEEKGHEVGSDLKLSASWDKGLKLETAEKDFSIKIGGRINFDTVLWNASQDIQRPASPSVNAARTGVGPGVGILDDGMYLRRMRLQSEGTFYEQFEYNAEIDFETLNTITYDNMYVGMKDLPIIGTVRVGQFKTPQGLESYSSSKNLMMMERSSLFDAFWNEFSLGIFASNTLLDERATWAASFGRVEVLNSNSGANFGDGNYAYTGRVTALPIYEADGRCLVHVGASYQWRRTETGRTQTNPPPGEPLFSHQYTIFRDRPELRDSVGSGTNAEGNANRFVSTGNIFCDNVQTPAVEFLTIAGPLTIQSEASGAYVSDARYPATNAATNRGSLFFWGAYAEVAYCFTGENRGYDKRFGMVGTIKPYEPVFATRDEEGCLHTGWGAWELCYRFSFLNLNDDSSQILGGQLTEHTVGVNWWLTQNMRLQMNYLNAYRDVISPATSGTVHGLGLRAIVEF